MRIPFQKEIKTVRTQISCFRGYDNSTDSKDGYFCHMKNMSGHRYPMIAARPERGIVDTQDAEIFDIMSMDVYHNSNLIKDALVADCRGRMKVFYSVDGKLTGQNMFNTNSALTQGEKICVVIGSKIYFFPDKMSYDLITHSVSPLELNVNYPLGAQDTFYEFEIKPCDLDGEDSDDISPYRKIRRMSYAVTDSGKKGDFIMAMAYPADLVIGDTVKISGFKKNSLNSYYNVLNITDNRSSLIVECTESYTQKEGMINVSRQVPEMDFVISSGNRLWGCRYGQSRDGKFVNEIYASAMGDPRNWSKYVGTASDSWTASIGSVGAFTGAVCMNGSPVFFKENFIIKVHGDYPSEFSVTETVAKGIELGSHKSAVFVNGSLFYKAVTGVVKYDGGLPTSVDTALGDTKYKNVVAGEVDNRYYVSMEDCEKGERVLLVYDTVKRVWYKEDEKNIKSFCRCGDTLYFLCSEDGKSRIYAVAHNDTLNKEGAFDWMCETHKIGFDTSDSKYLRSLIIRLESPIGSYGEVYIEYDDDGRWHKVAGGGSRISPQCVRVVPRRCDSFKIRICGKGECAVRSVTKTVEKVGPYYR